MQLHILKSGRNIINMVSSTLIRCIALISTVISFISAYIFFKKKDSENESSLKNNKTENNSETNVPNTDHVMHAETKLEQSKDDLQLGTFSISSKHELNTELDDCLKLETAKESIGDLFLSSPEEDHQLKKMPTRYDLRNLSVEKNIFSTTADEDKIESDFLGVEEHSENNYTEYRMMSPIEEELEAEMPKTELKKVMESKPYTGELSISSEEKILETVLLQDILNISLDDSLKKETVKSNFMIEAVRANEEDIDEHLEVNHLIDQAENNEIVSLQDELPISSEEKILQTVLTKDISSNSLDNTLKMEIVKSKNVLEAARENEEDIYEDELRICFEEKTFELTSSDAESTRLDKSTEIVANDVLLSASQKEIELNEVTEDVLIPEQEFGYETVSSDDEFSIQDKSVETVKKDDTFATSRIQEELNEDTKEELLKTEPKPGCETTSSDAESSRLDKSIEIVANDVLLSASQKDIELNEVTEDVLIPEHEFGYETVSSDDEFSIQDKSVETVKKDDTLATSRIQEELDEDTKEELLKTVPKPGCETTSSDAESTRLNKSIEIVANDVLLSASQKDIELNEVTEDVLISEQEFGYEAILLDDKSLLADQESNSAEDNTFYSAGEEMLSVDMETENKVTPTSDDNKYDDKYSSDGWLMISEDNELISENTIPED